MIVAHACIRTSIMYKCSKFVFYARNARNARNVKSQHTFLSFKVILKYMLKNSSWKIRKIIIKLYRSKQDIPATSV